MTPAGTGSAPPGTPAILIPAAGASSRMRGRDKLLETVRDRPLLADRAHTALAACTVGGNARCCGVWVALPPLAEAPDRWAALDGTPVHRVGVAAHRDGLSASLRAGVAALPPVCGGVMILPADMPDISADDIAALLVRFDGQAILRGASPTGQPGHPVLFPARDFGALAALTGDQGGRPVLEASADRVRLVPLPGDHATADLDTPEAWAAWRMRQT